MGTLREPEGSAPGFHHRIRVFSIMGFPRLQSFPPVLKAVRLVALAAVCALGAATLMPTEVRADDDDGLSMLENTTLDEYRLGANDRIRVTVYGEDDLSGEYEVDAAGVVSLPLIGEVQVLNFTVRQFERQVEERFADGYLVNPRVNAEVATYRPFYILGEVNNAGQYPYEPGMTIVKAVTTAGGFTYRANRRRVFITRRGGQDEEVAVPASSVVPIMPGDVIRVPERIF